MAGSSPAMTKMDWGNSTILSVAILLALAFSTVAHAAGFSGNFNGIGAAAGMTLNLQEVAGRVVGRLSLPGGTNYVLNGERGEKGAQGMLSVSSSAQSLAFFRMEERPLGVQFLFIPADAGGKPAVAQGRDYSFVAQGVAVAPQSSFLAAPPPTEKVDVLRFIDEYRQWDPRDVARVYATLDDRDRGLIQLYDHAAADLLWRVCAAVASGASVPDGTLVEMLDRQQTSCEAFLPLAEAAQKAGLFPEFVRRARFQFEIIRETVICNRGQSSPSKCADVSALGGPLIVNWRDAASIMRELAGLPAPSQQETAPGTLMPYPAVGAEVPKAGRQDVPLRTAIIDTPDAKSQPVRPVKMSAAALKAFVQARRHGIRLPLPDPRR